jgi:hypothetical protein
MKTAADADAVMKKQQQTDCGMDCNRFKDIT